MIQMINAEGEVRELNKSFSFNEVDSSKNIRKTKFTNRAGTKIRGSKEEARQFKINGEIIEELNPIPARQEVDELNRFLQYEPIKIFRKNEDRYIEAYLNSQSQSWSPKWAELELQFYAPDPFFYSEIKEQNDVINIDGSTKRDIVIINKGNRFSYPLIKIQPNYGGGKISITAVENGSKFSFDIEIYSGYILEIDCAELKVELNGENKLNDVNDLFLFHSLFLSSGENTLRFEADSSINFNTSIKYQSKWI